MKYLPLFLLLISINAVCQQQQTGQTTTNQQDSYIYNVDYKARTLNISIGIVGFCNTLSQKINRVKGFYVFGITNDYGGIFFGYKNDTITALSYFESISFGYAYSIIQNYLAVYAGFSYNKSAKLEDNYMYNPDAAYLHKTDWGFEIGAMIYYKWIGFFGGVELKYKTNSNNRNIMYIGLSIRGW